MFSIQMPGRSHEGALPPLTTAERATAVRLRAHVEHLAGTIGERNMGRLRALHDAAAYVERHLSRALPTSEEPFDVAGVTVRNVIAERKGRSGSIVVIGAHYDSVPDCPGANDNGSGVAALLEIADVLASSEPEHTLRFVAFPNEEAPYFGTDAMGALQHARGCRTRQETLVGMVSLETLGCYFDAQGSQTYPMGLGHLGYPSAGNFLAFVADSASRALLHRAIETFRRTTPLPSEGLAAPEWVPGISWSDHAAFWREGFAALMATDTAPFRYPEYHTPQDAPARLDYERFARATLGLARVAADLAGLERALVDAVGR